jgi:tryptophan-rich sensory protein
MTLRDLAIILGPLVASAIVSARYPMDRDYYDSRMSPRILDRRFLSQSSLTPPDSVFGIVWPILYLLIGYSLLKKPSPWLLLNLALNLLWLVAFNGLRDPQLSFYILVAMVVTLVIYLNQTRNLLLTPYLAWLVFATYLNFYIAFSVEK